MYGVSYDAVEGLKSFSDDYEIDYDLLSDEGSVVIKQFGILNTIIDPEGSGAERFYGIPFPGTYVVDESGVVTEKFFNRHYATRTSAGTILDTALGRVLRHEESPDAAHRDQRAQVTAFLSDPTLTLEVVNTLYVRIEMAEGFHIYAEPLPDGYFPSTVTVEPTSGVMIGEPVYPPTTPMRFDVLDVTLNVYEGTVDIAVPITLTAELFGADYLPTQESVELNVVVDYQACSDTVCYLPEVVHLPVSAPTAALAMPGR